MSAAVEAQDASGSDRIGWKAYLMVALVALALFLPGRARLPPVDRDEARYLQATRQMLVSHDFIDIRFQDKPRNLQPVGVYWLEAASASLFGGARAPVWAYRLPSLIAAVLAVLLTARIGGLLFGRRAGVGAGLLLSACALLSFESRMAKIDACLLASVLAAQGALLKAYLGRVRGAGRLNAAAFWAVLAVGLLLKGPIVLIVSGTTALGLVLTERRAAWLRRLHAGWGVPLMLAIAAPWFVAIGIRTHGAFYDKAVRQNLLGKIGRGEQHHGQPPGYYLLLANLTFWPGALAAALALPWTWRMRASPPVRFLLCWVLPTWLMYEAVGTKLPHYVLPLYPALACLACGAATCADGWRPGVFGRIVAAAYGALWLVISAALVSAGAWLVWRYAHRIDPVAIGFGMAAFGPCIAALWLVGLGKRGAALGAAVLGSGAVYTGLYAHVLPGLETIWIGPRLAALAGRVRPCPTSILASTRFAEPSLVFLEQGETRLIDARSAADLIASDRACAMAAVSARQLPVFTAQASADRVALKARGEVDGMSYSTGERLRLLLFTAAEAGGAPNHPQPFQAGPQTSTPSAER